MPPTLAIWPTAANATTVYKNSGLLRFQIDHSVTGGGGTLMAGQTGWFMNVLGDPAVVTPDQDNQVFGMSGGYGAIVPPATDPLILFNGHTLAAYAGGVGAGAGAGVRFPPNAAGSGAATGQARLNANGRIPAGTKLSAWFQATSVAQGGSTTPDEQPIVVVQTEVQQGREFLAGVQSPDGPSFLSSARVALANLGNSVTIVAGVLYVRVEHSYVDLPGSATQNQQGTVTFTPPPG